MRRAIVCASVFLSALSLSFGPSKAFVKDPSETLTTRLATQVVIRRDTYGVPHILAKTEEGAAFGFGYAQAEDHCLTIARRFVAARGEAAKLLGQGAEGDFLAKRFENLEVCRINFGQLDPLLQRIFSSYAAGLNHYVTKHRQELPSWIPVFDGVDVLANARLGAVNSAIDAATIRALKAKYPDEEQSQPGQQGRELEDLSKLFIGETELPGSNAFALSGSRTTSGKPILLGNPHLNWSSLYWEAQVTVPGKINFFGSTLAGIPVLRAGFNERLGWVTTNNNPDQEDIYALLLDPRNPDLYIFQGQSRPFKKKEVVVEIRRSDGSMNTERRYYEESDLGPIIFKGKTRAFAYRSTQLESFRHFEGFYRLSKARNLREWLDVMKLGLLNYSNFTYADAEGNILYQWNAHIPIRVEDGTSYALDVPGEPKFFWRGLHPMSDFPRLLNPSAGYIQNCNNPPWYTSLRNPIDSAGFKSYFERGDLGLRPQLALEMLESRPKFSVDDVKQMKFNTKMLMADRLKPDLIKAVKAVTNPSDDLLKGLAVIEAWDNTASADAKGAVLFQRFASEYFRATKKPYAVEWSRQDPAGTPSGIADPPLAAKLFEEAVKWTRETFGSESVAWGQVHRFRFKDVDLPGDGADGAQGAFRVMGFRTAPNGKRVAGWVSSNEPLIGFGDGWVIVVEFSNPVKAFSVLAYGQTTNPASKHSSDQIALFANHEYKRVWFSEAEIKANLETEYRP